MIFYTVAMTVLFTILALCATLVIWTYIEERKTNGN